MDVIPVIINILFVGMAVLFFVIAVSYMAGKTRTADEPEYSSNKINQAEENYAEKELLDFEVLRNRRVEEDNYQNRSQSILAVSVERRSSSQGAYFKNYTQEKYQLKRDLSSNACRNNERYTILNTEIPNPKVNAGNWY